ncbi:MAG: DUF58 domain-containing protein [Eubacterium sp.]|nr:DUF58 domain-containing protein [Eubacterium sp.]
MAEVIKTTSYGRPLTPKEIEKEERRLEKEQQIRRKPLKTVVHPIRIIAFGIMVAVSIYAYNFLRNHFFMLVLALLATVLVLDIVGLIMLYNGVEVKAENPERDVSRYNTSFLKLVLTNKSFAISMDVSVKLDVENIFYKDKSGVVLSLPCSMRGTYEKYLPLKYSMNGLYKYNISAITIRDLLGFISLKKNMDTGAEVNVYPERDDGIKLNLTDMSRGMTESEETLKKGHDFSDVSDVREYIPGDKLMSIHWKLSAKRDILMVKDRVSMSDQQMVIVADLSGEDQSVDEVLTLTYAVVAEMVKRQTYVRLVWWSEGRFVFEERQIMNIDNLKEAFGSIYYENIYPDGEKTKAYMMSIHPELKAYVYICMRDGEADAVVVEQD